MIRRRSFRPVTGVRCVERGRRAIDRIPRSTLPETGPFVCFYRDPLTNVRRKHKPRERDELIYSRPAAQPPNLHAVTASRAAYRRVVPFVCAITPGAPPRVRSSSAIRQLHDVRGRRKTATCPRRVREFAACTADEGAGGFPADGKHSKIASSFPSPASGSDTSLSNLRLGPTTSPPPTSTLVRIAVTEQ